MRTIEKFALGFGVLNLVLGGMSLFRPFVKHPPRRGIARMIPIRQKDHVGPFNKGMGQLMGMMGAVNPPHAIMHTTLGAAGVAAQRNSNLALPYVWLNALMFLGMAVLGWATVGMKPGNHNVMGLAIDRKENVIHTLWGASALALAVTTMLGSRRMSQDDAMHMVEAGLTE